MMKAIPGGPFSSEKKIAPSIMKNIDAKYHLNDPLWKQYTDYLVRVTKRDLGPSFKYPNRTVNDIISDGFPVSAKLGTYAVLLSLFLGLLAGVVSALWQNKFPDYFTMILATVGFSVPGFILAGVLQYYFSYRWNLLPAAMWGKPQQMIMPVLCLAALPMATVARLMRAGMLEVLQQDYIKTAKAKGLPSRLVIYRHCLRNAIQPVVTFLGPLIAAIFTGSFVIEYLFTIPGLGRFFVMSIQNRDYTVIMGTTVFYSIFLMMMNLVVDLAYVLIDPRIKLVERKG
jgi:oligopeptide transport system permease protein